MPLISRRRFISALGGLSLAPFLPGCGLIPDQTISIASHVWPGYEPLFLAKHEDWLDERQIRLVETPSATDSMHALAAGLVDGATLTLDEVLRARANGVPLSVVLVFDISAGADVLLAHPDIKSLADLKGRCVGVEEGAVGALMFESAIRAAGLAASDVQQIPLTIAEHQDAWQRKKIDAVVTYEPVASQLLARGAIDLFDSRQVPDMIVDVLALRHGILDDDHAEAIRRLLAADLRALEHLRRNPQDAAYRMAQHLKLPPSQLLSAFKGLVLPDLTNNVRLLTGTPPKLLTSARMLSRHMVKSGMLPVEDSLNGLIRADFLPGGGKI